MPVQPGVEVGRAFTLLLALCSQLWHDRTLGRRLSRHVAGSDKNCTVRLTLIEQILPARKRFDDGSMFLERRVWAQPITIRKMIVKRTARDAAANSLLSVLAPEGHALADVEAEFLVGESQRALVDHA
jgi:hypothetical protein